MFFEEPKMECEPA